MKAVFTRRKYEFLVHVKCSENPNACLAATVLLTWPSSASRTCSCTWEVAPSTSSGLPSSHKTWLPKCCWAAAKGLPKACSWALRTLDGCVPLSQTSWERSWWEDSARHPWHTTVWKVACSDFLPATDWNRRNFLISQLATPPLAWFFSAGASRVHECLPRCRIHPTPVWLLPVGPLPDGSGSEAASLRGRIWVPVLLVHFWMESAFSESFLILIAS